MMDIMGKIKQMQAQLKEAQEDLVNIKATAISGGGLVSATVNGKKNLVALDIDPSILTTKDKVLAQDLAIAAINKALADVDVEAKEKLRKSTEGLFPSIPGLDLMNMM